MATSWKRKLAHTKKFGYDEWLDYFRKLPATTLREAQYEIQDLIPADGFAALMRWLEILENPSKMDKLYKGRLESKHEDDIMELAVGDDDGALYEALIRKNTALISSSGTSPQEVARLSQNIDIFRQRLKEVRARKPKEGTTLARVLAAANKEAKVKKKPKSTPVKKKPTAPKRAGAKRTKKTGVVSAKAGNGTKKIN